jgi:hypothetical protein
VRRSALPCALLLSALLCAQAAGADEALDLAAPGLAPDSFATQAVGAPDLQVTRPGTLKAASSAMGAFVRSGKLAPGAAVEVTPWDLYFNGVTWREYVDNPWMRRFVNLAVSLATVGGGDTDPVRTAFAVRARLWDDADWRLNDAAIACARKVLGGPQPLPDAPPDATVTVLPEISAEQQAALKRCRVDNTRWNASQAALGGALTLRSPGGSFIDTRPDGAAGWASIALPMGNMFQWLGSLRYTFHKAVDATDTVPGVAALHVAGVGSRFHFHQGRVVAWIDMGLGGQRQAGENTGRALVGATLQVLLWGTTWGEVSGTEDFVLKAGADQKLAVTANLKWNHDITSSLK